jgi:hypothetical protein
MIKYRQSLFAGVASLALAAASGLALAQAPGGGMQGNEQHGAQPTPGMTQGRSPGVQAPGSGNANGMEHNAGQGTQHNANGPATGSQAQQKSAPTGQNQPAQQNAQGNERGGPSGTENRMAPSGQAQSIGQPKGGEAQNQGGMQGNAPGQMQRGNPQRTAGTNGANVQLSEQQRTQIHRTIIGARGAPRVGHVNFDVSVGTVIPRGRIHIVPVPETLVRIEPSWRGYLYFVYEDEVVVVNPRDMRIVAVLAV